jgi:phosphohistidine phosphatase SixA
MRLYLMRHGYAVTNPVTKDRELSRAGADSAQQTVDTAIAKHKMMTTAIYHSAYTRAIQTAAIAGGQLGVNPQAQPSLAPDADPGPWVIWLQAATDDLMLVGHCPFLSILRDELLGRQLQQCEESWPTAMLSCLEHNEDGAWGIAWVVSPT